MTATAQEVLMLALINRARLDPLGEASRYGIDLNEGLAAGTITAQSKQPLAFSEPLNTSARSHSQAMIDGDFFAHTNPNTGSTPQSRGTAAGYPGGVGENIVWRGSTGAIDATAMIPIEHQDLFVDIGIAGRGHRTNLMRANYQQIGVGQVIGQFTSQNTTYNASMVTTDFGIPASAAQFLTGIAYNDTNGDNFYSVGEGRGGITLTTGAGDIVTNTAGDFARTIGTGSQTVTFSGGGLASNVSVTLGVNASYNVLLNLIGNSTVETSTSLTAVSGVTKIVGLGNNGLVLVGTSNAGETIVGGLGNDVLAGLGGNDILDGGTGVDVAGYTGPRSNYQITKSGNSYQVNDLRGGSPDGFDTVTNVERFSFSSGVTSTEAFTPRNFNGDLKSDLAWYNDSTGNSSVFLMNGTSIVGAENVGPANGGSWDLKATGDLNGDGTSDMIWQNTSGQIVAYLMNGTSIASAAVVGNPGASFKVVGTGDFNADGSSDILLQDGNGQAVAWLMNGATIQSAIGIGAANGPNWFVAAIGDLNGDARADLVWQSSDGSTVGYLMNGGSVVAAQQIAGANGTNWSVKGIGDLNSDGIGDIVWQYGNGQAGAWLMNGLSIASIGAIGAANGSQFEIRDIADLNGDGKMDLVWENMTNGQAVGFLMNSTSIIGAATIGGANGADWKIV